MNPIKKHKLPFTLLITTLISSASWAESTKQDALYPRINQKSERNLSYDWPILKVGTGSYEEGPTGVTVFHFERKVNVAVDVRGGGPGTVNAPYMDLGYDMAELDTVVFAGGSWYGLEATTAVATALKDDGLRDGDAFSLTPNIAMSVGSIIFDFGARRLNEIYPDKRLAQSTYRAAKTGIFPLGPHGAGRSAISGGLFGCNAYSGQGGAYREIGDIKIAAFTVVNSLGAIVDRKGKMAACYPGENWPQNAAMAEVLAKYPDNLDNWDEQKQQQASSKNTTISLIVTNQKLSQAELKRLATQVHTSMARGIQPFTTIFDGDVLYAVSTAELEENTMSSAVLGTVASEVMWDAILSSIPEQPKAAIPKSNLQLNKQYLNKLTGKYTFSEFAQVEITNKRNKLYALATGIRDVFAIGRTSATELIPVSKNEFMVPGRYPLTLKFETPDQLIINPGKWQQTAYR
ncbi:P1 family peptidase [Dasania sp. GY-MA-18]|uniref:P1 family peptidase n=1 Tax=Dasania phycosphaerae TaxID=2950436 RepID=A0A9J6RIL7_9GAMM|nr:MULTISPECIES: P1 family peptidase [Dasania]MCR8921848.1 P1 family peptidase [Dasania sp. GY-MA-18]MCZ0864276.1 P1 family peptidase [Dasania phycosphaerae]MCZ0868004.1 P1 family peptidase [Dasania phycosphaerae]